MNKKLAKKIAKKIIENLKDRSGLFELDDDGIENEVVEEMVDVIMNTK